MKKLSSTFSNPTTSADKKFLIIEKSKDKFQPIPLHGVPAHLGLFSVTKQAAHHIKDNQQTVQVKNIAQKCICLQIYQTEEIIT